MLRGMAKTKTTVVLEVRIMVTLDRGQHMGEMLRGAGNVPFLDWILVKAFVCEKCILLKFAIHILCLLTFPGLCTAESVHTEG